MVHRAVVIDYITVCWNVIDTLEVKIWELVSGPDGTTEYAFETINKSTGKPSLGGGVAYIKSTTKSKL